MQNENGKTVFSEPCCEVTYFAVEDILTTSDDWGGGDAELWAITDV